MSGGVTLAAMFLIAGVLASGVRALPARAADIGIRIVDPEGTGSGIATGADGNLWYGAALSAVGRLRPDGTVTLFPIPAPANLLGAFANGPDANIWFTEPDANQIGRITIEGLVTEFSIPTPNSGSYDITAGPDGAIWFTESLANQIGRITPEGSVTEFPIPTARSQPAGITVGPDGALWFSESWGGRIGRITTAGMISEYVIPTRPGFESEPLGITSGPDGNLWYVDARTDQVGRLTPSGTFTQFALPTKFDWASGIVVGPDGNLWVTAFSTCQLDRVTPDGAITEFPIPGGTIRHYRRSRWRAVVHLQRRRRPGRPRPPAAVSGRLQSGSGGERRRNHDHGVYGAYGRSDRYMQPADLCSRRRQSRRRFHHR